MRAHRFPSLAYFRVSSTHPGMTSIITQTMWGKTNTHTFVHTSLGIRYTVVHAVRCTDTDWTHNRPDNITQHDADAGGDTRLALLSV